jgi:sugar phosphate isomerase/epimerase
MLSLDYRVRHEAVEFSIKRLKLANDINANCCVNVSGARGDIWYGLYPENYLPETYQALVETIQLILDAVQPEHTFFTVEPMPWMTPDSPEQYVKLIKDVNRKAFGVHLDFVNMINTPHKFAYHQDFIKSCFDLLGPHIKSIHMKDIRQVEGVPYSFAVEECPPGEGIIDFKPVLQLCESLGPDTTVFVEHMAKQEQYINVINHLRKEGKRAGVSIK